MVLPYKSRSVHPCLVGRIKFYLVNTGVPTSIYRVKPSTNMIFRSVITPTGACPHGRIPPRAHTPTRGGLGAASPQEKVELFLDTRVSWDLPEIHILDDCLTFLCQPPSVGKQWVWCKWVCLKMQWIFNISNHTSRRRGSYRRVASLGRVGNTDFARSMPRWRFIFGRTWWN